MLVPGFETRTGGEWGKETVINIITTIDAIKMGSMAGLTGYQGPVAHDLRDSGAQTEARDRNPGAFSPERA